MSVSQVITGTHRCGGTEKRVFFCQDSEGKGDQVARAFSLQEGVFCNLSPECGFGAGLHFVLHTS